MVSPDVKADIKQQEKQVAVCLVTFSKKYLLNLKYNVKQTKLND